MPVSDKNMPRHFVFLLLKRFSMASFTAAVEPLRIANRMSGETIYSWALAGESGEFAQASNGVEIRLDCGMETLGRDDTVLVCGGVRVKEATTKSVLNGLRRATRRRVGVGGLCTGA